VPSCGTRSRSRLGGFGVRVVELASTTSITSGRRASIARSKTSSRPGGGLRAWVSGLSGFRLRVAVRLGLAPPDVEDQAGSPVAVASLPARRAGLEGVEKSLPAPSTARHDGAERQHASLASRPLHCWSSWPVGLCQVGARDRRADPGWLPIREPVAPLAIGQGPPVGQRHRLIGARWSVAFMEQRYRAVLEVQAASRSWTSCGGALEDLLEEYKVSGDQRGVPLKLRVGHPGRAA
jgi:hypothetical protein